MVDIADAKSKKFEVKVYVTNIEEIGHKLLLHLCMKDDNDKCHGEKTVDLRKISDNGEKSRVLAATFVIKETKFLHPGDVAACGTLEDNGLVAHDCPFGQVQKVKAGKYKAVVDYRDLLKELFG